MADDTENVTFTVAPTESRVGSAELEKFVLELQSQIQCCAGGSISD